MPSDELPPEVLAVLQDRDTTLPGEAEALQAVLDWVQPREVLVYPVEVVLPCDQFVWNPSKRRSDT